MSTIEDQLAEAGRGIDRLRAAVEARSATAGRDDDWASFAESVESELRGFDTHLERLQANVAAAAWEARARTEAAIAEVRSRRIAVGERLAQRRGLLHGKEQR